MKRDKKSFQNTSYELLRNIFNYHTTVRTSINFVLHYFKYSLI